MAGDRDSLSAARRSRSRRERGRSDAEEERGLLSGNAEDAASLRDTTRPERVGVEKGAGGAEDRRGDGGGGSRSELGVQISSSAVPPAVPSPLEVASAVAASVAIPTLSRWRQCVSRWYRLARLWFVGRDRVRAWLYAIATLSIASSRTALLFRMSYVQNALQTALGDKNQGEFALAIWRFFLIAVVAAPLYALAEYVDAAVTIRWRNWLTEAALGAYFRGDAYFRIQLAQAVREDVDAASARGGAGAGERGARFEGPFASGVERGLGAPPPLQTTWERLGIDASASETGAASGGVEMGLRPQTSKGGESDVESGGGGEVAAAVAASGRPSGAATGAAAEASGSGVLPSRSAERAALVTATAAPSSAPPAAFEPLSASKSPPPIDNPDARICGDIQAFANGSARLLVGAFRAALNLCAFAGLLWSLSRTAAYALTLYALVVTSVTALVFGRAMVSATERVLAAEADQRYGLVRVRDAAESLALYGAGEAERVRAVAHARRVAALDLFRAKIASLLSLWNNACSYTTFVMPSMLVAPAYFAGTVPFGAIAQVSFAFHRVQDSLVFAVDHLEDIAALAARADRVAGLLESLEQARTAGVGDASREKRPHTRRQEEERTRRGGDKRSKGAPTAGRERPSTRGEVGGSEQALEAEALDEDRGQRTRRALGGASPRSGFQMPSLSLAASSGGEATGTAEQRSAHVDAFEPEPEPEPSSPLSSPSSTPSVLSRSSSFSSSASSSFSSSSSLASFSRESRPSSSAATATHARALAGLSRLASAQASPAPSGSDLEASAVARVATGAETKGAQWRSRKGTDGGGGERDGDGGGSGAGSSLDPAPASGQRRLPGAASGNILIASHSHTSPGALRTLSAPAAAGGVGGMLSRLGALVTGAAPGQRQDSQLSRASRRGQWVTRAVVAAARRTATVAGFGGEQDAAPGGTRRPGTLMGAFSLFAPHRLGSVQVSPRHGASRGAAATARRRRRKVTDDAAAGSGGARRGVAGPALAAVRAVSLWRRLGRLPQGRGLGASLREAVVSLWSLDLSSEDISAPWDGALPGFSDVNKGAEKDVGTERQGRRDRRLARKLRRRRPRATKTSREESGAAEHLGAPGRSAESASPSERRSSFFEASPPEAQMLLASGGPRDPELVRSGTFSPSKATSAVPSFPFPLSASPFPSSSSCSSSSSLSRVRIASVRLPSVRKQEEAIASGAEAAAARPEAGAEGIKGAEGAAVAAAAGAAHAASTLTSTSTSTPMSVELGRASSPGPSLALSAPVPSASSGLPPLPSRLSGASPVLSVPRPPPRPIVLEFSHVTFSPPGASRSLPPLAVDLSLCVRLGDRVLVVGRSGAGKSSLLRVAAGLWTQGRGAVRRLDRAEAFFIPQVPFMPQGTLRDQLVFPRVASAPDAPDARDGKVFESQRPPQRVGGVSIQVPSLRDALLHGSRAKGLDQLAHTSHPGRSSRVVVPFAPLAAPTPPLPGSPNAASGPPSDEELLALLSLIGLSHLAQRHGGLDAEADWPRELSPGEQQRIAIGRALARGGARGGLQLALLDEASAALDAAWEGKLYAQLCAASGAMVSVGHRMELVRYHTHVLQAKGDGRWKLWDAADYARAAGVQIAE